jgi:hypothetical protein
MLRDLSSESSMLLLLLNQAADIFDLIPEPRLNLRKAFGCIGIARNGKHCADASDSDMRLTEKGKAAVQLGSAKFAPRPFCKWLR